MQRLCVCNKNNVALTNCAAVFEAAAQKATILSKMKTDGDGDK